jgi:hypothetical protein
MANVSCVIIQSALSWQGHHASAQTEHRRDAWVILPGGKASVIS